MRTSQQGYKAYKKALDILSNQDEYDINMLALPGVLKQYHSSLTDAATQMVETRGDAFYVMDLIGVDATVTKAVNEAMDVYMVVSNITDETDVIARAPKNGARAQMPRSILVGIRYRL